MKVLQIENITAAELLEMLSNKHKPKGEFDFVDLVPLLTKEQTADVLQGSRAYVDKLVREGILEPVFPFKNRPGTCRFRTKEVIDLFNKGYRGRKSRS